jgi:shikimate kinase
MADETRKRLLDHTVVYLSVEVADAIKRVGLGAGRPMLKMNPRATMRHLLDLRRPLYEEVATIMVRTDGLTPDEVTTAVLAGLPSRSPRS